MALNFLIELVGIPNIFKINAARLQIRRAFGLRNAFALRVNGYATILYDPEWAQSQPAEFYLILGHEAGHIFCGHIPGEGQSAQKELEADRFGGASVKRFEIYQRRAYFNDVLAVANSKYSVAGDKSHPPRAERIEAIKRGYEQGSFCGNLVPVN